MTDPEQGKDNDERDLRDTQPDIELEPEERVTSKHSPEQDEEEIAEDDIDMEVDLDEPPESEGPDA